MKAPATVKRKTFLIVLFIPSFERDGLTPIDQDLWVHKAIKMLGETFGGATAFPRSRGVWRDDDNGEVLVFDNPIVIHCYVNKKDINNVTKMALFAQFCRDMATKANQGEVGAVIVDEYWAFPPNEDKKE